ncbi:hypothetical protein E4U09_003820 [Claviceps aff. purpurea]|uniref:Uncharacterized protein n=1 Tax=Claviceps aff. purpurea TaxID=1967640 RepID=A0A9P7U063_9HYPO|nr:hypothetical protein E4U09_003820 [Claviceps aff. purpurea]
MKFCIVAFITLAAAVPPVQSPSPMQDQSPALLESNPLTNLTIVLKKKKKLMPVPCRL